MLECVSIFLQRRGIRRALCQKKSATDEPGPPAGRGDRSPVALYFFLGVRTE